MLCLLVALGAAPASADAKRGSRASALVLGKAHSPVLKRFARQPHVRVRKASRVRHRGPRHHTLLIIDGNSLSPKQMLRRPLIGRYLTRRRWILALDLKTRHHVRAISRYTGFESPDAAGEHRSRMFLFRRALSGSMASVPMIDTQSPTRRGARRLGGRHRRTLRRRDAGRLARLARRVIKPGIGKFEGSPPQGEDPPPEALHLQFPLTKQSFGWDLKDGYWTKFGPGDTDSVSHWPNPGSPSQRADWTMHHTFDVYLQNPLNPTRSNPEKQIVTYNLNGEFSPKHGNQPFFQMYNNFTVPFNDQAKLERAWWTGELGVSVKPHQALTWEGNQPRTPDSETQYINSEKFDVDVTVSQDGAKAGADYSVGTREQQTIPDWGVESTTEQRDLEWTFSSRSPCDPRTGHYSEVRCFEQSGGTPKLPSDLSLGQLQVFAQGRWSTSEVLPRDRGELDFTIDTPVTFVDTFCGGWGLTSCCQSVTCAGLPGRTINTDSSTPDNGRGPPSFTARFNVGDVLPVPIKSLTFKPPCANGNIAQKVTGVVKLNGSVPREFEHVTVDVFSDSENAVVGPPSPSGHGSQNTTNIKGGESQGTFKIETNDNKLTRGAHTRAAISIFYGDSKTEQLEIYSGRCPE